MEREGPRRGSAPSSEPGSRCRPRAFGGNAAYLCGIPSRRPAAFLSIIRLLLVAYGSSLPFFCYTGMSKRSESRCPIWAKEGARWCSDRNCVLRTRPRRIMMKMGQPCGAGCRWEDGVPLPNEQILVPRRLAAGHVHRGGRPPGAARRSPCVFPGEGNP